MRTPWLRPAGAALGAALSIAGCATTPAPLAAPVAAPMRLAVDVAVALPDRTRLTYRGLADDSRCPRGVQCIHAGSVELRFDHAAAAMTSPVRIRAPRETSAALGTRWRLTVVDVDDATPSAITVRVDPRP
jgi:hypothetical protein